MAKRFKTPTETAGMVLGSLIADHQYKPPPDSNFASEQEQWEYIGSLIKQDVIHARLLEIDKILVGEYVIDAWTGSIQKIKRKRKSTNNEE